jgi:hypothetical protein
MKNCVFIIFLILGCGQNSTETEINTQVLNITPVLNAAQAKEVFEKIDANIRFTGSSNEYFGVTDHIYYADLSTKTSQTTINIGKRADEKLPFTNIYISISADKPLNDNIRVELNKLLDKYVFGFLSSAFDEGNRLFKRVDLHIGSEITNKEYDLESDNYFISYKVSKEDGNPHYITCLLQITENSFQKELNQRIIKHKWP